MGQDATFSPPFSLNSKVAEETESGSAGTQPDKGYSARRCANGASTPGGPDLPGVLLLCPHWTPEPCLKNPGVWGKAPVFHPQILRKTQDYLSEVPGRRFGAVYHLCPVANTRNAFSGSSGPRRGCRTTSLADNGPSRATPIKWDSALTVSPGGASCDGSHRRVSRLPDGGECSGRTGRTYDRMPVVRHELRGAYGRSPTACDSAQRGE